MDQQQYYYPAPPFVLDSFSKPDTAWNNNMSCFSFTTTDHDQLTNFSSIFPDPGPDPDHETYDLHHQEIPFQIHESTTTRPPLHHKTCTTNEYHHPTSSLTMVVHELGSSSTNTHPMEKVKRDQVVKNRTRDSHQERKKRFSKKQKKVTVEVPSGYVHARARRGQATDSHSLAERVRRQKISVRMKLLQSLVPGCDKMIGKALILDETVRYVMTLQSQVQFLADKFSSLNPMLNNDFEIMNFNTNPVVQEKTRIQDFDQLQPPVLESSSTQLLHQEQSSNIVTFHDNCNLLRGGTDEGSGRKQELVNEYGGLHNLHSF
ncbi:hypothetical protein Dsin_010797 [Dipteronia sinensis]|uniref:BHLH domain-containing protein n=1 Tax=Dipteronia sinensis TaxID=43782 RepID=A0AAE0ATG6_9ROSI|nr:hypothetical protein Dsin_010797 [Dipteronia sinensis]